MFSLNFGCFFGRYYLCASAGRSASTLSVGRSLTYHEIAAGHLEKRLCDVSLARCAAAAEDANQ